MATEKILIFDEAGNAKRMKVRIARFLDNEPVTATDKENIRTTLDVDGSQSGDFTTDITTTQKVGIGDTTPAHPLTLTANPGAANTPVAWLHNSGNVSEHDGTVISTVNDGSDVEVLHVRTNTTTYNGGTSLMLVQGDGNVSVPSGQVRVVSGAASAPSYAFDGDTDTGMSRPTTGAINFVTQGSERVRIDSSGNTGFGQPSPSTKVDVNGVLTIDTDYAPSSAVGGLALGDYQGGGYKWVQSMNSQPLVLNPLGNNVGIGDTSPDNKLTIDSGDIQLQASKATDVDVQSINWKNTNSSGYDIARITAATGGNIYEGQLKFLTKDSGGTMATRATIDSSGNFGVGADPGSTKMRVSGGSGQLFKIDDGANPLVTVEATGGLTVSGGRLEVQTTGGDAIFSLNRTDAKQFNVYVDSASALNLRDQSAGSTRLKITGSGDVNVGTGNLVIGTSGKGIDFSATGDGSGTMSSEVLNDYEEGTWSPAFSMTGGDFTTAPTMDIIVARYVKVGHMVTFYAYLRTDSVDITGAGGSLAVEGLPYANAGSNNYAAINVGQANFWTNAPSGGYVYSGGDYIVLTKRNTGITGSMTEMQAADLTAGASANQNQLMISGSYFSF